MRKLLISIFLIIIVGVLSYLVYMIVPKPEVSDTSAPNTSGSPLQNVFSNEPSVLPQETKKVEETTSKYSIAVSYPYFSTLPAEFNNQIKASVDQRIEDFKNVTESGDPEENTVDFTFEGDWVPVYINNKFVSFIIRFESYTGGANINPDLETFNFNVEKKKVIKLGDLFPGSTTYLSGLSTLSREQLIRSMGGMNDGVAPIDMINEGTKPLLENFRYFNFTKDDIIIYFPKYSVGPGAFGEQKVAIPLAKIN